MLGRTSIALHQQLLRVSSSRSSRVLLSVRSLSTTSPSFRRKRVNPLADAEAERNAQKTTMINDPITLDISQDGLNRYELDFLESAEWTKELLLKMKNEVPKLKVFAKPYTPPSPSQYLCFETHSHFTYDFTSPLSQSQQQSFDTRKTASSLSYDKMHSSTSSSSNLVKLHVRVSQIPDLTPAQKHKLLLLAGDKYDPYIDVITLESRKFPYSNQNKKYLSDQFDKIMEQVKKVESEEEAFTDIPVDLRHVKPKVVGLNFPKEWVQQASS